MHLDQQKRMHRQVASYLQAGMAPMIGVHGAQLGRSLGHLLSAYTHACEMHAHVAHALYRISYTCTYSHTPSFSHTPHLAEALKCTPEHLVHQRLLLTTGEVQGSEAQGKRLTLTLAEAEHNHLRSISTGRWEAW